MFISGLFCGVERCRLGCHGHSRSWLLFFVAIFSSLLSFGLVFGPLPPAPSLPWWLLLLSLRCLVLWLGLLLLSLRCLWPLPSLRHARVRLLSFWSSIGHVSGWSLGGGALVTMPSLRCLLRRQLALRRCVASLAFAALRFDVDASLAFTAPLLTASTLVALSGPCRRIR